MGLIANLRKAKEKILCKIKLQKNHVKVGKNISFLEFIFRRNNNGRSH